MHLIKLSLQERQRLPFCRALLFNRCLWEQASGSRMVLLLQRGQPSVADVLADIALTVLRGNSPPKARSCVWWDTLFAESFFHMGW